MSEREPDPGFTVVDRRRRTEDEATPRPVAAPPPAAPPSAPRPAPSTPPPGPTLPGQPDAARADLTALLVMLYSDAMANLGQVPDPATGRPHVDLEQARFAIDLLAVLQDKTQGNRTPEESAVLQEMLSTLRMGFVQLSQGRRGGR